MAEMVALCLVAMLAFGIWLSVRALHQRQAGQLSNSSLGLFNELCQAHNLDRSARQALLALAKEQQFAHPAMVFLERTCFDAIDTAGKVAPVRSQLATLRVRLFED